MCERGREITAVKVATVLFVTYTLKFYIHGSVHAL